MKTKFYRVITITLQIATIALLVINAQGSFFMSVEQIAIADAILTSIIMVARQLLDPQTPTLPPAS